MWKTYKQSIAGLQKTFHSQKKPSLCLSLRLLLLHNILISTVIKPMKLVQMLCLDNQTYISAKVPWKEKTVNLARLHSSLKTDNGVVYVNPFVLFSRLILLAEREEETTPCFEYELTNYPFLLFWNGMMRNGNNASLCSFLMKVIPNANLPTEIVQVNDGETLLFQIKSLLFTKSSDIYMLYEKSLYSKYGYC